MSGLIPQPFIDELLTQTDIVELIDSYVPLKKSGANYTACCPFHNEKTPSFNVVARKQFYHCFGCGANGNAISFIKNYLNQGFIEAVKLLASRLGLQIPDQQTHKNKTQQSLSLYQLMERINQFYQQNLKFHGQVAIDYLRSRGVDGKTAKRYQLGYAPDAWHALENQFKAHKKELVATGALIKNDSGKLYDRYRSRIIFPIHDQRGRIVGFGGRAIHNAQKPKYLNSPETAIFHKSRELYGLYQILAQKTTIESIILVEGYMDVIALAQHDIGNAVATLGTATSNFHIQLLTKHTQKLVFCFDGDLAGQKAAWKAFETCLPHLNTGLDARFMFLPENDDPDSLIRREGKTKFLLRLANATLLNRFFLEKINEGIDTTTLAGKNQLINAAKPYLIQLPEGPYKQLLLDELARITHIESYHLNHHLKNKLSTTHEIKDKTIIRSPIRLAIALLIQYPENLQTCYTKIDISSLDGKGQGLLQKLLWQIMKSPDTNTAMIIERWRNTASFELLSQLASWDHQVPEKELQREFLDIILFLQKQNFEKKIRQYLAKSRNQGLTLSEKQDLQKMLQLRHQNAHTKN